MVVEVSINDEFFDALVHHQVNLVRYSAELRNKAWDLLSLTNEAISSIVQERLGKSDVPLIKQWALHDEVMKLIRDIRGKAWDEIEKQTVESFSQLVQQEEDSYTGILLYALPVLYRPKKLSEVYKKSLIKNQPINGKNLVGWIKSMRDADMGRISAAVNFGVAMRQPGKEIARTLFGTKLLNGQDGIVQSTFKQVQSVMRTFVSATSSNVFAQFIQNNQQVFSKERYTAILDNRTSAICRSLDGRLYNIGEGPIPPLHFNCRSIRVPVLSRSVLSVMEPIVEVAEELFRRFKTSVVVSAITLATLAGGEKKQFDEYVERSLNDAVGPAPQSLTYAEWFAKQTAEFQDEILGKVRGRLYRDGGLSLDRFVARDGTELTLAELARRESTAFKRAGLNPKKYL